LSKRAAELDRGAVALLKAVEHVEGWIDEQALVDRAHELEREGAGAAVEVEVVAALDRDLEHREDHARGLLGAERQQEEGVLDVGDLAEGAQLDRRELDVGLLLLDVVGALGPGDDGEAEVAGGLTDDDAGDRGDSRRPRSRSCRRGRCRTPSAHMLLAALAVVVCRGLADAGPRGRRCNRRGWRSRLGLRPPVAAALPGARSHEPLQTFMSAQSESSQSKAPSRSLSSQSWQRSSVNSGRPSA
jgi:hypothetical protein